MAALKNKRRELFCNEYAKCLNSSEAARRAKYSPHVANRIGSRLLTSDVVSRRIEEIRAVRWRSLQMSDEELKARIAATARFDPRKLVDANGESIPLHKLDDETAWAIASVDLEQRSIREQDGDEEALISVRTTKYRAADKGKAQEMLSRMANLFKQDTSNAADAAVTAFAQVFGQAISSKSGIAGLIDVEPAALPDATAGRV